MIVNVPEITVTLTHIVCGKCSTHFAMDSKLMERRLADKGTFYCPNGHSRIFNGDNETDRLKKELAEQQRHHEYAARQLESERRQHAATKGQLTKTRNRIAAGVCPDCNRSFENVARHMVSKHSDRAPETKPRALSTSTAQVKEPSQSEVRAWLRTQGETVAGRGQVSSFNITRYKRAHPS